MPFRLGSRQYIDFSGDFRQSIAKLKKHLRWMASPEGILQALNDRLEDAQRELPGAPADQQARIKDDIAQLQKDIENQQRIIADPEGAKRQTEQSIKAAQERERQPERPISGVSHTKFIKEDKG